VGWPAVEFAGESSLKPFAPIRSYRREEEEEEVLTTINP
jgi:hypothetical protein